MAEKVWFHYGNERAKVPLEGIDDVADLRDAIKLKMIPKLDEYAVMDLIIRAALIEDTEGSQAVELRPEYTLESISQSFGVVNKPFAKSIHFFPPTAFAGK